jgi:phage terminase Nu1 subunit (DNA packaging protein)
MSPLPSADRYNVSELARALGVAQPQVSQWKAAGMPFKNGRTTLAAAVRWLREHERRQRPRIGAGEAQERRAAAEAELAELRLARERADLILAADAQSAAEDEAVRVGGVVSQIPTEFAPLLAQRLGVTLRQASAVLREVADGVRVRLAAPDLDREEEAA